MSAPDPDAKTTNPPQESTQADFADLDAQFHKLVDDGKLANVVTLVARHGKVLHRDAYGLQSVSATDPVPVKTTSIYRIASMLKPLIGTAMMLLWEEGLWTLDDPVSKFIPSFATLKVRVKKDDGEFELVDQETPMNMRQLMSHTAGFISRDECAKHDLRKGDLGDMISVLSTIPLAFQPGKDWIYGPSVDIQGYIIEQLSGQTLDDFLSSRLFKPLEMHDTGFVVPESKVGRLVHNHQADATGKLEGLPLEGSFNVTRPKFIGGGMGIMSTADDYFRFCQMLLNGGSLDGKTFLKPSTVELMQKNVLEEGVHVKIGAFTLEELRFGMGVAVVLSQSKRLGSQKEGSYFWMGLYGTWFWIDPVNSVVVVGLVNEVDWWKRVPFAKEYCARAVYKALGL